MNELTDINEILDYLATFNINHDYYRDVVRLTSEYFDRKHFDIDYLTAHYRSVCVLHKNYELFDSLFVNCIIDSKYKESNYNIQFLSEADCFCFMYRAHDKYIKAFKDINGLITYMQENYPECVRPVDIKIALK
jgi:hypothetical protein